MDLTISGAVIGIVIIGVVGWSIVITAVCVLWYGRWYWSGVEKNYTKNDLMTWVRYDPRTGHLPWFWRIVSKLLKHSYDRTQLDSLPDTPVIFSCQPHGIFALSAVLTFLSGRADRPGCRVVVAIHGWYWWVPGLRDLMSALGCINCRWTSIENALCNGYSVAIMPGGILEMGPPLIPLPKIYRLVARVYELGPNVDVPLVPVFFKGEDDICWTWKSEPRVIKWLRLLTHETIGMFVPLLFCPRVWNWPSIKPIHNGYLVASQFKKTEDMQKQYDVMIQARS